MYKLRLVSRPSALFCAKHGFPIILRAETFLYTDSPLSMMNEKYKPIVGIVAMELSFGKENSLFVILLLR